MRLYRSFPAVVAAALLVGCNADSNLVQESTLPLETRADSVAYRVFEYHGGPSAWNQAAYVRFDFAIEADGDSRTVARHLWNRQSGDYRVEWETADAETVVALFQVDSHDMGSVYIDGSEVKGERLDELLGRAYQRYINDSYWLSSGVKMFDPGVSRFYEADSSNTGFDVIRLEFDGVGLTPGDRYWYWVDGDGRVDRWAYILQGNPNAPASFFEWQDYREFGVNDGTVRIAGRKAAVNANRAIVFPSLDVSADVDYDLFADPQPRL
jgi:hypothetical protein